MTLDCTHDDICESQSDMVVEWDPFAPSRECDIMHSIYERTEAILHGYCQQDWDVYRLELDRFHGTITQEALIQTCIDRSEGTRSE